MGKPTIDDVAALAGVGRTTVSRVLNGKPNVREAVRETVLRAVDMLGFQVNLQARNLAGRNSHRIALIHASDFDTEPNSYYHSAIELGATRAAARLGLQLSTHIVNQNDPQASAAILAYVRQNQCEGLILTPPFSDDRALIAAARQMDCCVICIAGGPDIEADAPTLGIDDRQAGFDIGTHLLALGHRRFGFIHGLKEHLSAESRFAGFRDAVVGQGIDPAAICAVRGNFTFRSGIDCAQMILAEVDRPTAVVCANDDMAAGALLAAHKAGFDIPGDVAITGFDDTPVSEIVWPPLTTIHQPLRRMGERAVERIFELTLNGGDAGREIVPHQLVIRDSTTPARI